ncbi:unnamed protein product [Rhizoctonia solani]|uniref:FIST domain-containing protein n=1 Tax=Rhizoctonia solani TaxID=456999 RepID=A0A8H3H3D5_9AGAM|nr:unnamed protein product [Rhizoctonia solani]
MSYLGFLTMVLPTFRTYIAPKTQSLLRHLGHSSAIPVNTVNLFALSAHADDLQDAVAHLTAIPNSIGALTASPFKGVQLSIASYPTTSCLPFRSTIPGTPQAQVGRIRTYRPPSREEKASEIRLDHMLAEGNVDWNDALSESGPLELPSDLQRIRDKSRVSSFFYLSDGKPEGLLDSLHRHFPVASQLGLIGTSTPFINGRPFTLFKGTNIFSDGAVGIALLDQPSQKTTMNFDGIHALSEPMEVTQAQTNLVEALDNSNPVEGLVAAMRISGTIDKDQDVYLGDVYLGVIDSASSDSKTHGSVTRTYKYSRLFRITAGGPSRGSLLLDATEGPQAGTKVQFATASSPQKDSDTWAISDQVSPTLSLSVLAESHTQATSTGSDVRVANNLFAGASENGLALKKSQERPWICSIPGTTVEWVQ